MSRYVAVLLENTGRGKAGCDELDVNAVVETNSGCRYEPQQHSVGVGRM